MSVDEHVALSNLTSMRVGGKARFVITAKNREDIQHAYQFSQLCKRDWFILGDGTNVLASDDYNGVIILNRIRGFKKIDDVTYKIGAGEEWDSVVERLCAKGLTGVEGMSLIPGRAGSTPVQNVGAYGQEIADTLISLTAYDTREDKFIELSKEACNFGYRTSIFKRRAGRRYIICDITLRLTKGQLSSFYPSLQSELDAEGITDYSPASIRQIAIRVRRSKLPDPAETPSAGSFFKNPLVDPAVASKVVHEYPNAPHWDMPNGQVKLAAGWLIEQAGLKGYAADNFQIYPKNALVITNINNGSATELAKFKTYIIERVREKFGVTLEQEPEDL